MVRYVDNLTNAANAIDNAIDAIDGFLRANVSELHGSPKKAGLATHTRALRKIANALYTDVEHWTDDRLVSFKVSGTVFSDYFDPDLGTEMATICKPFYEGSRRHGNGRVHWFIAVPVGIVKDVIEDMENVADLRLSNGGEDGPIGRAMLKVIERLKAEVAA